MNQVIQSQQKNVQRNQYSNSVSVSKGVAHSPSPNPRVSTSYYNALPMPVRALIYIPVTVVQTIQQNVFPSILLTEGLHVFRQNFGLSQERVIGNLVGSLVLGTVILTSPESTVLKVFLGAIAIGISSPSVEKALNNLLLYGMVLCTISKFYVNPWFDKEHESINAIWHKMSDKTIPDEEYYKSFYASVWEFTKALSAMVSMEVLNNIFSSMLNQIITFKKQDEFGKEWLTNFAAYGVSAVNKSSGSEADNEKANLNPVKIFEDIEHESELLTLWNTRVNTIIDCFTACYAMFTLSPTIALSFYFGTIILPRLLLVSFAYSLTFNTFLSFFERPAEILHRKLKQLKDLIIRQITNIDHNAESMTFLEGEEFEANKLLALIKKEYHQSIKHDLLDSAKGSITSFIGEFQWLFPILATLEDVRNGIIRQEEVGPYMSHYFRINKFMTWTKSNFEQLDKIRQSLHRLDLYKERIRSWGIEREEMEKKVVDSDVISFSGSIFLDDLDENRKMLLAHGSFVLEPGSITHFSADSGSGKTTLFRIFRRVWANFDGTFPNSTTVAPDPCTMPKQKTAFLPSQVYVLGPDEPLFQTICYPIKYEELESNKQLVQGWLRLLNLRKHVCDNLTNLSLDGDEKTNQGIIFNWMISLSKGERQRIAFCNILLKLATQDIKFLILDEPFDGIDFEIQQTMVELLKDVIRRSNPECTVLFSTHGYHHELNTHTLTINKDTKEFKLTSSTL